MFAYRFGLLAMLAGVALAAPAHAAPFCVQTEGVPPQCIFVDAGSCAEQARKVNGYCTVNTAELHIEPGLGHYCLLSSGLVSNCYYPDSSSCEAEARRQRGVCVSAPARAESPPPDPYRRVRPLTVGGGARE